MKKKLYLFKASVMIYAEDIRPAVQIAEDLNEEDVSCFIDVSSALNITERGTLEEWLHLCPVESVEREPIFSLFTTEELLNGEDEDTPCSEEIWNLKKERAEIQKKLSAIDKELLKYQQ